MCLPWVYALFQTLVTVEDGGDKLLVWMFLLLINTGLGRLARSGSLF